MGCGLSGLSGLKARGAHLLLPGAPLWPVQSTQFQISRSSDLQISCLAHLPGLCSPPSHRLCHLRPDEATRAAAAAHRARMLGTALPLPNLYTCLPPSGRVSGRAPRSARFGQAQHATLALSMGAAKHLLTHFQFNLRWGRGVPSACNSVAAAAQPTASTGSCIPLPWSPLPTA